MNYYVGVSLASGSTMDSGVAVIDEDNKIILLDKLYKMNDIIFFFENFSSLKNSKICVSVPFDRTMLEGNGEFCLSLINLYQVIRISQIVITGHKDILTVGLNILEN